MTDSFTLADAVALAEQAHAGQVDRAGRPYVEHVRRVAEAVGEYGEAASMAALLHDVIEDTPWTLKMLTTAGVPTEVLEIVDALTKRPGEHYEEAVRRAAAHPSARIVKLADNRDNADEARLGLLAPALAAKLRAKYARARQILNGEVLG